MTLFDPANATETFAPIFLELGKEIGKQVWAATGGRIKQEGDYAVAARRYRDEIIKQYNKIQIYGLARPTPLLDIFTEVHVLPKPVAMQRYTVENLEEWYRQRDRAMSLHEREERRPGLELVTDEAKLFILGKPGAGKTTFLKYLAVWAAKGHEQLPKIPIFISLKEYSDANEDLFAFIERQFVICGFANARPFIERLLEKGKALVLCDGLDEVSEAANVRGDVIDDLRDFARQYRESTMVVTCRLAATDYTFEGFTYVEMADFTPAQVEHFVGRWFAGHDDTRQRMLADLRKPDHKGILELTQNPLLLSLLCIAYEETLTFPSRRVEVYEDALDALLRKWDASRKIKRDDVYRKLSLGRKRQMLARIAYDTFSRGEYFLPQRKLEKQIVAYLKHVPEAPEEVDIDGEAVLKAIAAQHGLLVERSQRIYSFSHLTFQEYFAARFISDNEARGALDELIAHVFEDPWREVFLLVASLLDDADAFFGRFLAQLNRYAHDPDLNDLLRWTKETALIVQQEVDTDAIVSGRKPVRYSMAAIRSRLIGLALSRFGLFDEHGGPGHYHTFDSANLIAYDIDQLLALDISLGLDLYRSISLGDGLPKYRDDKTNYIEDNIVRQWLSDAQNDFDAPKQPKQEAANAEWQTYAERLHAVISKHRPSALVLNRALTRVIEKNASQVRSDEVGYDVASYIRGVRLLVDCLDVAYVSDRKAIEDRLLLPPAESGDKLHTLIYRPEVIQGDPNDLIDLT